VQLVLSFANPSQAFRGKKLDSRRMVVNIVQKAAICSRPRAGELRVPPYVAVGLRGDGPLELVLE
jgi:hypothetical protein